jgi:sterol desaturase/sphingolipid hydroxylase (fatty acid hydroxylase superfamily)
MGLLTALFSMRVFGQAVQRWLPQPWLPQFAHWQGSAIAYAALLPMQVVILAGMIRASWRAAQGRTVPSRRAMKWLAALGSLYMAVAIARIAIGVAFPSAPAWFTAFISGAFHLVLAGFILALAGYHSLRGAAVGESGVARVLPYVWYPLFLAAALAAFFTMLAHGAAPAIAAYVPAIAVAISIVLLELRFHERDDWRPTRSDVMADAAFMGLVMVAFPRLLMAFAVIALADVMHANFASGWWPQDWPLWMQMILMVLAVDFVRYWLHRACHRFIVLWRLHEVHHSPDLLYMLNVGRFHPLEKVLHFALDSVPFLLLGVTPEVFAGYFLVYSVNGFFQHSNLKLRYGWLNYLVGSAETHRWHHARDPRTASCNFGNTTIVWDLAFGTWHLPGPVGEIGIMNREYPRGFLEQMATPFHRRDGRPRRSAKRWLADTLVALRLRLTSLAARKRLARTMRDPMRVQRELLARILEANRDTTFGKRHGFERIDGYAAFASQVPVSEFEQLRPFVDAEIASGE